MATQNGTSGDDSIQGTDRSDQIDGREGDDTIVGGGGDDNLNGGAGNDSIVGGGGTDNVQGGAGDDTIVGGDNNDNFSGGDGADLFVIDPAAGSSVLAVNLDGGSGGDDRDSLDLRPLLSQGFKITNFVKNSESDGMDGFNGQIQLRNDATGQDANINFSDIERFIPCFTPGTLIATTKGEIPVETLRAGDRVITRDTGIQEIRWVGEKRLIREDLRRQPELRPVLIRQGALGNGMPERDMLVSPNHRMLTNSDEVAFYFEDREVLVAAKHLTHLEAIDQVDALGVSYIHFMFDRHEVVLSDGAWSESFQAGDLSLKGLGDAQRNEIISLFPELADDQGIQNYRSARRSLKKYEARLLTAS